MIERRRLFSLVFLLAAARICGAQEATNWTPVPSVPAAKQSSCTLVDGDDALLAQLKKLGWTRAGKDFPDIPWTTEIAAVVSTPNPHLKPKYVGLANTSVVVRLAPGSTAPPTGVLVIQLDRAKYQAATSCNLPATSRQGASTQSGYESHVD